MAIDYQADQLFDFVLTDLVPASRNISRGDWPLWVSLYDERTISANEEQLKTVMRWWLIQNRQLSKRLGILQHGLQFKPMFIGFCGLGHQKQQPNEEEFHGSIPYDSALGG